MIHCLPTILGSKFQARLFVFLFWFSMIFRSICCTRSGKGWPRVWLKLQRTRDDSSDMRISKFSKIMIRIRIRVTADHEQILESPSSSGASRHGQPAWLPTFGISRSRQLVSSCLPLDIFLLGIVWYSRSSWECVKCISVLWSVMDGCWNKFGG